MRIEKRLGRMHIRIRAQSNDWRAKLSPTFNSGWSPTMYQQRTPSTVSRSVISTWRPVGLVIWNVDLAPESTSRYRHRLETSIGTRTLCGCIRRMASVALARRSSPRKQWYWPVRGIRFTPDLPVWKQEAFATLPMGTMNKFSIQ